MSGQNLLAPYRVEVHERRRVGLFGGTFDPPHVAHVVLAAAAIDQLELDALIVTVAGVPWQKVGSRQITPATTRLEMAEAAFSDVDDVAVSDIELRRTGNSYTVDTLHEFADEDTELFLLLGSDTAAGLDTWDRPREVAELAKIAVFPRRGYEDAIPPADFVWLALALPGLEISSTDLRRRARAGRPIAGLVPPRVREIIEREGLYRSDAAR
jgi:nicotinate-nucleotide adenylyltransferase